MRELLMLMALVAMGITIVLMYREVGPLRDENRRLRKEAGFLIVDDKAKVNAIRVETDSRFEWKWRIWIPAGRSYEVTCYTNDIGPKEKAGRSWTSTRIFEAGEHVIRYVITSDPRDSKLRGNMEVHGSGSGNFETEWARWDNASSSTTGVNFERYVGFPDQAFELTRYRVSQDKHPSEINGPCDGFMIWIEPAK